MQNDLDSYQTLRTVSSIGFIAGGALAAAGVVLLVTDKPSNSQARNGVRVGLSAGRVWAEGRF
jgi:hypothetical protein